MPPPIPSTPESTPPPKPMPAISIMRLAEALVSIVYYGLHHTRPDGYAANEWFLSMG